MSPARSKSQQRLMQAAAHGATFKKAREVRESMSLSQLNDFTGGSMKGKPERVTEKTPAKGHPNRHLNLGKFLHERRKK